MPRDSMETVRLEGVYVPVPEPVSVVPRKVSRPQPWSRSHIIILGVSCAGISAIILYYLSMFIIECTKNPYLK